MEVFRACPPYGFFNASTVDSAGSEDGEVQVSVLLTGRNIRNSRTLTCRFRPFVEPLSWNASGSGSILSRGRFISPTRVECPRPSMLSLLRAIGTNPNANEEIPSSIQVNIDASNDGQRFSGDERFIPYTSAPFDDSSLAISSGRKSHSAPASFVTLNLTDVNALTTNITSSELEAIMSMEKSTCLRPRIAEESPTRSREQGWYELPFMRQAHLSFDWRHIPSDMKLDEHYKLSIYARPSRCDDTRCNDRRERIPDLEESPCPNHWSYPNGL